MDLKFLNKTSFYAIGVLLTTSFLGCDLDETQEVATLNNLVWEDNFDVDGTPDASKWIFEIGDGTAQGIPGWGNNELQYYTDRPENVSVENGVLQITARQEPFAGSSYTSARLITKGLFQQKYGRFEARIKLPTGQGLWPAFWLLGDDSNGDIWPQIGEIDIMEYLGDQPTQVFGTIHGPQFSGAESISKDYVLENDRFDAGFHIFGIEWSPNKINFYVDDKLYQTLTPRDVDEKTNGEGEWVFNDRPFYMILNVAVGGNLPGPPNAETMFPQSMYVDYVRVYN
ncbi:glycosyl hydrolase family 16 [Winogradskyella sp. J14-2]|uniref:glycoside hydrolase family 16 protein n=1 Tax=Winogradskyella sp. J14-2 TaxID=1936080 RepID=UPI000972A5AF|nr:glycoside hydrolase family 16 protein [Winogradskyella sp. J14-2]APY08799.1 glycosyl hydrolase family 16 [Winogradskyella sp. J14-2]